MATIEKLLVGLGLDAGGYSRDVDSATRHTDSFIDRLDTGIGGASTIAAGALMRIGEIAVDVTGQIAGAVAGAAGASIDAAADYQTMLSVFAATSNATADEMARLDELAVQLGNDIALPGASAASAAEAMVELNRRGISINNTFGAARGVLQLAAAAQIDNAKAAEIVANALDIFGLKGEQAGEVGDMLINTFKTSGASVDGLAEALKYVGPAASQLGVPMDQILASLGSLAKKGIEGSEAGTQLRGMLVSLASPSGPAKEALAALGLTIYDTTGAMKPLPQLITEFTAATEIGATRAAGMSEEQAKLATKLREHAAAIPDLTDKLGLQEQKLGILQQQYAATTETQGAASIAAQNQKLAIDTLLVAIDGTREKLESAQGAQISYDQITQSAATATTTLTEAKRDDAIATIFGREAMGAANIVLGGGIDTFNGLTEAINVNGSAQTLAAATTQGLAGAQEGLNNTLETLGLQAAKPLLEPLTRAYGLVTQAVNALSPLVTDFTTNVLAPGITRVLDFAQAFADSPDKIGFLQTAVADAFSLIQQYVADGLPTWKAKLGEWLTAAWQWLVDAKPQADQKLRAFVADLGTRIAEKGPEIATAVGKWIPEMVSFILKAEGDRDSKLATFVAGASTWLIEHGPEIGKALLTGLKTGIEQEWPGASSYILNLLTGGLYSGLAAWWGVKSPSTKMIAFAGDLVAGLWGGFSDKAGEMGGNVYRWFDQNIIHKMRGLLNVFPDIGKSIADSLWGGLQDAWGPISARFNDLWNQIPQSIRDALQMHSPSRVLWGLAGQAAESVIGGAEAKIGAVADAGAKLGDALASGVGPLALDASVSGDGAMTASDVRAEVNADVGGASAAGGGSQRPLIINLYPQGPVVTPRDLITEIRRGINEENRRNGRAEI